MFDALLGGFLGAEIAKLIRAISHRLKRGEVITAQSKASVLLVHELVGTWSDEVDFGPLPHVTVQFRASGYGTRTQGTALYCSEELFEWRECCEDSIEVRLFKDDTSDDEWILTKYALIEDSRTGGILLCLDHEFGPDDWFQTGEDCYTRV